MSTQPTTYSRKNHPYGKKESRFYRFTKQTHYRDRFKRHP